MRKLIGWTSPKEYQKDGRSKPMKGTFKRNKICKATKGAHVFEVVQERYSVPILKYKFTDFKCKCGKKYLKMEKIN